MRYQLQEQLCTKIQLIFAIVLQSKYSVSYNKVFNDNMHLAFENRRSYLQFCLLTLGKHGLQKFVPLTKFYIAVYARILL